MQNNLISQDYVEKKGGICFRVDDNHSMQKFQEYTQIFDNYNQKFSFALNLSDEVFNNPNYRNTIMEMQNNGHELMDHTPNHRTDYFYTNFPISEYKNDNEYLSGIDHILENANPKKVCLSIVKADTNLATIKGKLNITDLGDSIFIHNYNWNEIGGQDIFYLYLPEIDTIIYIPYNGMGAKQPAFNFWGNKIILSNADSLVFYGFKKDNMHLTIDAVKILAGESQKLALHHGFEPPKTWIQPGGIFPLLYKEELKAALDNDSLNYVAGAVYPQDAKQVFNEYNPNDNLNFAMQWGDFLEDEKDIDYNIKLIAHNYAKHHILIGHSHFYSYNGWNKYLERTDSIVSWAVNNNVPIKTYAEWADILYKQTPDPYQNIFPPLNVDLDKNGIPDGYGNLFYPNGYYKGIWEKDSVAPSPDHYCYSIADSGGIAYVQDLGGVEKGKNDFEIWIKGAPGNTISVIFEYSYFHANESKTFTFPATDTNWTKFNLSQSTNGNSELIVPDTMSTIFVYIECSNYVSDTVKISGMTLRKFIEPEEKYLDLTVFLEGNYSTFSSEMINHVSPFLPKVSPYPEDLAEVETLPNNVVDWVLVELRHEENPDSIISSRSAFVLKNGKIVDLNGTDKLKVNVITGNYFIVVKHRNHLAVMSKETIPL